MKMMISELKEINCIYDGDHALLNCYTYSRIMELPFEDQNLNRKKSVDIYQPPKFRLWHADYYHTSWETDADLIFIDSTKLSSNQLF